MVDHNVILRVNYWFQHRNCKITDSNFKLHYVVLRGTYFEFKIDVKYTQMVISIIV